MVQIKICTRGPDNGDMVLVSHLEDMKNANCLQRKGPFPGGEVPDFSEMQSVLQCSTVDSVTSHKARLILDREQLRGLWSEIRRCTLPAFFASAARLPI